MCLVSLPFWQDVSGMRVPIDFVNCEVVPSICLPALTFLFLTMTENNSNDLVGIPGRRFEKQKQMYMYMYMYIYIYIYMFF